MKLKSYFTAALFVCLTLGLATSCKEKDPAKGFTLSKEELTIGVGQSVYYREQYLQCNLEQRGDSFRNGKR